MKTQLAFFGQAVLWRAKRHVGALNKYDSAWSDGVSLGVSGLGIGVLIGVALGILRATDYRIASEGRWSRQLVFDHIHSFIVFVLSLYGTYFLAAQL